MIPRSIRALAASIVLLVASSPALAGELDVSWEAKPAGSRGAITLLDVEAGALPPLEVKGPDGDRYRMALELRPEANDVVTIQGRIEAIQVKRSGSVKYKLVAEPIVSTSDGERATVSFSPRGGVTFEVQFLPRLAAELNRPPMFERPDPDEPGAAEPPADAAAPVEDAAAPVEEAASADE